MFQCCNKQTNQQTIKQNTNYIQYEYKGKCKNINTALSLIFILKF